MHSRRSFRPLSRAFLRSDNPGQVGDGDRAFREAALPAVDPKAAASCLADDACSTRTALLQPSIAIVEREDRRCDLLRASESALGQSAGYVAPLPPSAPSGEVDLRNVPRLIIIEPAPDAEVSPCAVGTPSQYECCFAGA